MSDRFIRFRHCPELVIGPAGPYVILQRALERRLVFACFVLFVARRCVVVFVALT